MVSGIAIKANDHVVLQLEPLLSHVDATLLADEAVLVELPVLHSVALTLQDGLTTSVASSRVVLLEARLAHLLVVVQHKVLHVDQLFPAILSNIREAFSENHCIEGYLASDSYPALSNGGGVASRPSGAVVGTDGLSVFGDPVGGADGLATLGALEAVRVVVFVLPGRGGLSRDWLVTGLALVGELGGVAVLADPLVVHREERLPRELLFAFRAHEAGRVEVLAFVAHRRLVKAYFLQLNSCKNLIFGLNLCELDRLT